MILCEWKVKGFLGSRTFSALDNIKAYEIILSLSIIYASFTK